MAQEISKEEVGSDKYLGMANYNIYFKNKSNRLVMNITKAIFLLAKCAYMMVN